MELGRYYELLKISDGDRILVESADSLILGLYIAGRAKSNGLKVSVHVLVPPDSRLLSETDAVNYAKTNFAKDYGMIAEGAPLITFSVGSMANLTTKSIFNKAIVSREDMTDIVQTLSKVNQVTIGEKLVLLDASFQFAGKFTAVRKKLFGEKKETVSFRQLLKSFGFQIAFYDAVGSRVLCLFSIKDFDSQVSLSLLSLDEFSDLIRKEILDYIVYSKAGIRYAVESSDKEYLYVVQNEKTNNQPIHCSFAFLDGKGSWSTPESKETSMNLSIVVLPNTDTFRTELEGREILIMGKEKAFELYGEKIEPY